MKTRKLTADETAFFCEQLAIMLSSGLQLGDGLDILSRDIDDNRLSGICSSLSHSINSGCTLAQSMTDCGVFPDYAVKMTHIGEATGRLDNVLNGLSGYYEEQAQITRTVRSAVLRPLVLTFMMSAVMVVMLAVIVPMFGDIFTTLGSGADTLAGDTMRFAYTIGTIILCVTGILTIILAAAAIMSEIPSTAEKLSAFAAEFPLTRRISRKTETSAVASALALMVSTGISSDEAIEQAYSLAVSRKMKSALLQCQKEVLEGASFAEAIAHAEIFPAVYSQSLKIAYTSGSFERAWNKLSEQCSMAADRSVNGLISVIEPVLVIILTAAVGAVLLTIMLPLMNIMSVLG